MNNNIKNSIKTSSFENTVKKQLELIRNYQKNQKKKQDHDTEVISLDVLEDTDIYTEDGVEEFSENDAITIMEEGFMVGYLAS